ncbi:penicillin-binding transpeptidase domain-containing protein [Parafilimonas terrae]|uniref:Cell division protein FtsI (Penicillin-binding protein 3) n=1 Tax=Parafilimonas terrae TaxID=1465490 RepID=A0A1I5Z9R0_9BACT|nr:penicillin-binding transpeptidase domain-containing protein [Parafilimonas terrae]SFQ53212.1 cell division protein FtsI (penicillin-binding protein 3) [Parafilimonas terrae]
MEIKKDILWRVYLCFIVIAVICACIVGKAFYIQQVQGAYWRGMSDSMHTRIESVDAERGTIYSEDGQMLSTSIPQFDIYVDFKADGLIKDNGKVFKENIDSLSLCLANLFQDKTAIQYKAILNKGYKSKARYFALKKKVSFDEYQQLKTFPLVRLGKNKSGFIAEVQNIRLNPYQLLAFRTIGLERQNAQKVGLEQTYDTLLKGTPGKRLVRYISGGVAVPVNEDYDIEPKNGKDIVTTLDSRIQEIAENALMKMMVQNEAEHGCAIVMEVKTGKIKAIANLGRQNDGSYWEDFNYAMSPGEPGSTFKLATMLAVLEDKKFNLGSIVNLEGGTWQVHRRTVYDSEQHGQTNVTVKRAFELSSNVGMAKLAYASYANKPSQFINHLKALHLDTLTGIDLYGERSPFVDRPGSKYWSATTLPWMAFGYNVLVSPLHICMLYNAVANDGVMMRPYLLNSVMQEGNVIQQKQPYSIETICDSVTLKQLQECLVGVCKDSGATAFRLFKGATYSVAGKTGTALVANGKHGYADHIYQSSFAGYFPADNPQYTCVVVIKNKPHAAKFYGALVAGPVFREIADRLVTLNAPQPDVKFASINAGDNENYSYAGYEDDIKSILSTINISYKDSAKTTLAKMYNKQDKPVLTNMPLSNKYMPALKGLGLKDALYICEDAGLVVKVNGVGKVANQSITEGTPIEKGQQIKLDLN